MRAGLPTHASGTLTIILRPPNPKSPARPHIMTRIDRQRGTLLGLAIGDALGAAVEFQYPGTFDPVTGYRAGGPHGLAPGQWTDDSAPDVSGQSSQEVSPGNLVDNVERPWLFGQLLCLGGTLMEYAIHRLESSPDNVGHGRSSEALAVPLGRVTARLRKEPAGTFGKVQPRPRQYQSRPGGLRDKGRPQRSQTLCRCLRSMVIQSDQIHGATNYPVMLRGAADRCRVLRKEPESKRRRWSVNMGTREARLSRVVAKLGRSSDPPKHLPMRQSSGGAPVVVRGVNDDHTAKGCRMIRVGQPNGSPNREASR